MSAASGPTGRLDARLLLDLVVAGLLLFGLSYWWLGNLAHEVAGTAMFLLVILHNVFNRRWYGAVAAAGRKPAGGFNLLVTALLLVTMLALLGTSILISNALSGVLSAFGGFTVRQIHTLAAYWAMIIVSIHLGLRWPLIMARTREWLDLRQSGAARVWALRLTTAAIAVQGIHSFGVLGLDAKLSMAVSLDWWNFEDSVAGFFGHCLAVSGLCIALSYHVAKLLRRRTALSHDGAACRPPG